MLVKHAAAIALFLMVAGTTLVVLLKDEKSHEVEVVPQQMIGGSMIYRKQGPWPECVGMTSEKCKGLIEHIADDISVKIVPEGTDLEKEEDFDPDVVYVVEDEDGLVVDTPGRGW